MTVRAKVGVWMTVIGLLLPFLGFAMESGWLNISWFGSDLPVAAGMCLLITGLMTSAWAIATGPIEIGR
ncbi:MAG: hypothetical protein RLZZ480_170 [Candidatus Parcubacteria bacterium]